MTHKNCLQLYEYIKNYSSHPFDKYLEIKVTRKFIKRFLFFETNPKSIFRVTGGWKTNQISFVSLIFWLLHYFLMALLLIDNNILNKTTRIKFFDKTAIYKDTHWFWKKSSYLWKVKIFTFGLFLNGYL